MSNHFSAADFKSPGGDARLDLTDLFVFAAPDNPAKTVLIMNSNPFTQGDGFHPDAVYRFNIDTDGDAHADVAFSFTFSPPRDGRQTATAYYATGSDAQTREPRGETLIADTPVGLDATATPVQAGPCHAVPPYGMPAAGRAACGRSRITVLRSALVLAAKAWSRRSFSSSCVSRPSAKCSRS